MRGPSPNSYGQQATYMAERTARLGEQNVIDQDWTCADNQNIRCVLPAVFEDPGAALSESYTLRHEIE
jgi:hypothetical protein